MHTLTCILTRTCITKLAHRHTEEEGVKKETQIQDIKKETDIKKQKKKKGRHTNWLAVEGYSKFK
jgi:hypothetical protein